MKKSVLRFSLLLAAGWLLLIPAQAQQVVPNGAMETWSTRNSSDVPAQWLTTDDLLNEALPGFPVTNAVSKSTDFHTGNFAAKLTNSLGAIGVVPGFLALGSSASNVFEVDSLAQLGGIPYTSRAAQLQFYYKFTGTIAGPEDRPVVRVQLTKSNGSRREVVASGRLFLGPAAIYTLATLPLTYRLGFAPDSLRIVFGSGDYEENSFTVGNSLWVDDITLTGTVTATRDARLQAAVSAYPNPSSSGLFTLSTSETDLLTAPFTVSDALGRVVLRQAAEPAGNSPSRTVDLRTQAAGIYSLHIDSPRGPITKHLVIR